MSRTSHKATLQGSDTIAQVGRRPQAELNVVPAAAAPPADERARQLAWAKGAVRARRERDFLFGKGLFSEGTWEILLDLFIARLERRDTPVKSVCQASTVPQTTALRYIAHLVERGLILRRPHPQDSRCTYLHLSDEGFASMIEYFSRASSEPGEPAA